MNSKLSFVALDAMGGHERNHNRDRSQNSLLSEHQQASIRQQPRKETAKPCARDFFHTLDFTMRRVGSLPGNSCFDGPTGKVAF